MKLNVSGKYGRTQKITIIIFWLRSKRMFFFQFPVVNFFNFAETKTKHTPRALKMMKIALTVVIISFFGVFGKDRKIADDFILATPCYPRCKRELDECKEFHKCSGRRQSKRKECLAYCTDWYYSCMKC